MGQLILRKIIKIATRCQILMMKCTKIDFGCGPAPDPAGEAYSSPPDPLAGRGILLRKREGSREGKGKRGRNAGRGEGKGREEKGVEETSVCI